MSQSSLIGRGGAIRLDYDRRCAAGKTFFPWEEMCLLENLLAAVRQDGDLAGIQPRKLRK